MKRSPLSRKSPLRARATLRRRPKPPLPAEDMAAKAAWKEPHAGYCTCGCDPKSFAPHLERHHVLTQDRLKREGRHDVLWDPRNSMLLCPRHHGWHTDHFKLIRIEFVPPAALQFALEVLGEGAAAAYFEAQYDCTAAA